MPDTKENVENSIMEIEEGELEENSSVECNDKVFDMPTFEIVFSNKSDFENLSNILLTILERNLNPALDGKQFTFVTSNKSDSENKEEIKFCIQAFESNTKTKTNSYASKTSVEIDVDANCDQNSNDSQDFGVDLNNLFTIDPSPSTVLESAKVPSYKRANHELLDVEESKVKVQKFDENACTRPKTSICFNCGDESHILRDCPMPRDGKRINRAKKAHASKGERYHVDCEQKFAHLRPGVISEKLQNALRLRRKEIPSFFYRMRKIGYPPGWLEDAKVSHSGLNMFNSEDDILKNEENNDNDVIKYDVTKLIDFPGFNLKPSKNVYDDYKYHNVPPFDERNLKEKMIHALGDNVIKGYKLKKMKDNTTESDELMSTDFNVDNLPHDMEIEDDEPVVESVEFTRPPPPPTPPPDAEHSECQPLPPSSPAPQSPLLITSPELVPSRIRIPSPTLDELEEKQKALLLKLEIGEDFNSDDNEHNILVENRTSCSTNDIPIAANTLRTPEMPSTPLPAEIEIKNIIKSSHMGTPVLKFSPFEKLPAGDNFKVGVSDVINFENLPESTGKYEAMKEVIIKVRNIKKRLHEKDY